MKTTITKQTIKTIMAQARSLGAMSKGNISLKTFACEIEIDGNRTQFDFPAKLFDWLKTFDTLPAVEIVDLLKNGRLDCVCRVTDGKRTSALRCEIPTRSKPHASPVFLRISGGELTCIERIAKLAKVEYTSGGRYIKGLVLREIDCGKFILGKWRSAWQVLFQPTGMLGAPLAKSNLWAKSEAQAIELGMECADMIIGQPEKMEKLNEQAIPLAKGEERKAREASGEVLPEESVATPSEEITEAPPVAEPAKVAPVAVESVTVSAPTRSEGITEEKRTDLTGKRFGCPSRYRDDAVFIVLRYARAGKWVCTGEGFPCSEVQIHESDLVPINSVAVNAVSSPAHISSLLPAELQSKNEGEQPAMAYSKPVQTPPATVTPGNPPAPPVKPDSRKAKPVKRDLASPRQCHAAPSPWRYPPCQRNRPPPARNLGDLARLPSARQTAPPALMFFAPVLSASPPVRGNYETFSPSRIHLYPPSRGITTMTTHSCTGWRVIEHASTGRFIHTFDDEFLAIKFAVSIGSQAEPFTLSF